MRAFFALALAAALAACGAPDPSRTDRPVNAVVGDAGFEAAFGRAPTAGDPEALRIRTHLAFVEGLLRARPAPGLSAEAQANRARLLDELAAYREAGVFPRNTTHLGRTPIFIDEGGRLCAVGHLVATSAGREAAEAIDRAHHADLVEQMPEADLLPWAAAHGFTLAELAAIQPMYCGMPDAAGCVEPDPPGNGSSMAERAETAALVAGAAAAGANAGLLALGRRSRFASAASVLVGGGLLLTSTEGSRGTAKRVVGGAALGLGLVQALRPARERRGPQVAAFAWPGADGPAVAASARWTF